MLHMLTYLFLYRDIFPGVTKHLQMSWYRYSLTTFFTNIESFRNLHVNSVLSSQNLHYTFLILEVSLKKDVKNLRLILNAAVERTYIWVVTLQIQIFNTKCKLTNAISTIT